MRRFISSVASLVFIVSLYAGADAQSGRITNDEIMRVCVGCDMSGVNLQGHDLHGIRLQGTNLRRADLRNANLKGVVWQKIQAIDKANVDFVYQSGSL